MHYQISSAQSKAELEGHVEAWQKLAGTCVEPNVFYEPAPFMAAIDNLTTGIKYKCIFVYRIEAGSRQLVGFFPFLLTKLNTPKQLICYRTFIHLHCYLCTPLIDKIFLEDTIDALLNWISKKPGGIQYFCFYKIGLQGPVSKALYAGLKQYRLPYTEVSHHKRAIISLEGDAERYFQCSFSRHRKKEFRRIRRKLAAIGELSVQTEIADTPDGSWVDRFLSLESRGWKGDHGFAMDNSNEASMFFYQLIRSMGASGQVILHTLWLNDNAVAMKCNLVSADGSSGFAFKIAYDERYARYSPGVLLELDNIEDLYKRAPPLQWMDSCADPNHPMIDHLWRERRQIGDILCGTSTLKTRWMFRKFPNLSADRLKARH